MFVEAGGHLLHTVQIGTGARWFVAHGGWVGSWELWQEPMQLMQADWRCLAYDHRGTGASTAPPEAVDPEAAARLLEAPYERGVAPDLTKVAVPTLVVHGAADAIVPPEVAEAVAAAVPDAELVLLPDTGHVPTMTRPGQVVTAVDAWAARLSWS